MSGKEIKTITVATARRNFDYDSFIGNLDVVIDNKLQALKESSSTVLEGVKYNSRN